MTRAKAALFRLIAVALGALAGLVLVEVAGLTFLDDRAIQTFRLPSSGFEVSDVPGIPYLYRAGLPGVTNRFGLLDPNEVHLERRPGSFRILVVGDSVTASLADRPLDSALLYPHLLESKLREATGRDVEVLNLSSPGLSLLQEVSLIRARGLRFSPDLVLIGYCYNDVVETDILDRQNLAVSLLSPFQSIRRLASYRRDQLDEESWYEPRSEAYRRLEKSFDELAALAADRRVAVIGLPLLQDGAEAQPHLAALATLTAARRIACIDLLPDLAPLDLRRFAAPDPRDRVHYNTAGHEAIATALARRLAETLRTSHN